MRRAIDTSNRIKKILLADRMTADESFYIAMRRDLHDVLNEYLDLLPDTLEIEITEQNGSYNININTLATRVKSIKVVI